ncbi:glycosyltransferase family 2 protein [Microbacterium protaetiae]|uniref:Glycosyltransferase family 2 protein n=1 Tax=Microbacterium protaetiae TaxID=2509458 RepID=A0A4P6ECM3_9MICO|nr:glycosyltransferase family 2 protein [Microbacterium protaetiae]QAY59980.1 glycosyltransferase family 2 protein [Microbacterium protaetiae]
MTETEPRFVSADEHADVAVIIVTYNSADDLPALIASLRPEASSNRLRVVVADNDSNDDTVTVASQIADIVCVPTGGNLGYAGGINVAMRHIGDCDDVLILNPDLTVDSGSVTALRTAQKERVAGIVVPRILTNDELTRSLRNEPSLVRALGDAAFGSRFPNRPAALSETIFKAASYGSPREVDWATGAALLIRADVAREVGPWDERFFLYSEETDFFRRVRMAGHAVWYEPSATVHHSQGGSGSSIELDQLLAVNRIRYSRKHNSQIAAALMRGVVTLHELVRAAAPAHRAVLGTLLAERSWSQLPRASKTRSRA